MIGNRTKKIKASKMNSEQAAKMGKSTIAPFANAEENLSNSKILAIPLVSDCSILGNENKLHRHGMKHGGVLP